MPVRSRSRASSASKKLPQSLSSVRSSSNSASAPLAMTPPSLRLTAGCSATSRTSSASASGGATNWPMTALTGESPGSSGAASASSSPGLVAPGASSRAKAAVTSGRPSSVSRSADRSRGRALLSATRAAIRSMSQTPASASRSGAGPARSAATSACRCASCAPARSGWCRAWRSQRLPAAVQQVSSTLSRVGSRSPARVSVSSRLRRVAASM